MSVSTRSTPRAPLRGRAGRARKALLFALAGAAALLGVVWWGLVPREAAEPRGTFLVVEPEVSAPAAVDEPQPSELLQPAPLDTGTTAPDVGRVSLDPLLVSLELLFAESQPREDVRPLGSGRAGALHGRLAGPGGAPVVATVTFAAGANAGRTTTSLQDGTFALEGLRPGLGIVEVAAPGLVGSRREVRLSEGRATQLNIGYGRLSSVAGRVIERRPALRESDADEVVGLASAQVLLDGQAALCDGEGYFFFSGVAGGATLLEVEHPGYGALRQTVHVMAGRSIPAEQLTLEMRPEAGINLVAGPASSGSEPAQVFLIPSRSNVMRGFPWHKVNPIEVIPGTVVRVGGLPPVGVEVRAFHRGSLVRCSRPRLTLRAGDFLPVELDFQPAPSVTGVVRLDGQPAAGVTVTLEAPDQTRATLAYFKRPHAFLETEVLPVLPPARESLVTGRNGTFRFTAWSDTAPKRYLEARTGDGMHWAGRIVEGSAKNIELNLEPIATGSGALVLDMPGRDGPIEVDVRVDGRHRDVRSIPAGEPLTIESLPEGQWRLRVESSGRPIERVEPLRIGGRTERVLELPAREPGAGTAALDGMDSAAATRSEG